MNIDLQGIAFLITAGAAAWIAVDTRRSARKAEERAVARAAVVEKALEDKALVVAAEAERKAAAIAAELVTDREARDAKLQEMSDRVDGKLEDLLSAREQVARHEGEAAGQAAERAAPMVPAPAQAPASPGVPAGTQEDPLHAVLDQKEPVPVIEHKPEET